MAESKSLAKKTATDFPEVETPREKINIRKALAGLYLLQGEGSQLRCLMKAGYSRSTARKVTANGLTAERCIKEAAKFDPAASPANLLDAARRRMAQSLAVIDPIKTPLKDVTRAFEATEKYFGGHQIESSVTLTSVADRLSSVAALLAVAQRRGLPVPAAIPYQEAELVATSDESVRADKDDTLLNIDGSGI